MPLSRRRLLRLGVAFSLAGAGALLPTTAILAEAPGPPVPYTVARALDTLAALGFDELVATYRELRPTIEFRPGDTIAFAGTTEGWWDASRISATIGLWEDLQSEPVTLTSVLAHELQHIRQMAYQRDVYVQCLEREVAAYRVQAAVLRAWSVANPSERHGLSTSDTYLMSVAENGYPESLASFAGRASCGLSAATSAWTSRA